MAAGGDHGSNTEKGELDSPGLVSDCRLMLSFARKNGFVLPPPLLHEIAWLDSVLAALKITPVSQMTTRLIWPINVSEGPPLYFADDPGGTTVVDAAPAQPVAVARGLPPEEVILDVHSKLSQLIAPTTALSLQTSEPPAGKNHIFGGMPPLVQYVIWIAFFSAIFFMATAARIASKAVNARATEAAASAAVASVQSAASAAAAMSAPLPSAAPASVAASAMVAPPPAASRPQGQLAPKAAKSQPESGK